MTSAVCCQRRSAHDSRHRTELMPQQAGSDDASSVGVSPTPSSIAAGHMPAGRLEKRVSDHTHSLRYRAFLGWQALFAASTEQYFLSRSCFGVAVAPSWCIHICNLTFVICLCPALHALLLFLFGMLVQDIRLQPAHHYKSRCITRFRMD